MTGRRAARTVVAMNRLTAIAAAIVLAAAPAAAQGPMVRTETVQKISAHVHAVPDASAPMVPNVGVIVGEKAVLVVDTGMGPKNGAAVAALAARLAPGKPMYLVATHFHPEHDLGAEAFAPEVRMIRSEDQQADIAEYGLELARGFSARSSEAADLLRGANFRKADITFRDSHVLDLGGVTARLMAMGPNHTRGDTAIWIPEDRVLFSGDVVMSRQPSFAQSRSSVSHWLTSLDRLEALKPAVIVPAHGPNGGLELIAGYRGYLTEVRDTAAAQKRAGASLEAATAAVAKSLGSRFPDSGRLAGAARAAYAEAR